MPDDAPALPTLIPKVVSGDPLTVEEAEAAFTAVMEGRASPVQITALLVGLRAHGESPVHVAGGVRALRIAMIPVQSPHGWHVVDTCGTGGGAFLTFNISTAAALLAAGAGARIAKHGNRSFTSRCGSADVLAALDVPIELTPEQMTAVFQQAGIVFMFAPLLHPAMRHVAPVRRELGMPTIMNLLGPLTNPASARRQVVGVSHPRLLELVAGALRELGHEHALVVHGNPGMDEISPIGTTDVIEVRGGNLDRYTLDPAEYFDAASLDPNDLRGGDPDYNARVINEVLRGELGGAARAAVVLNAGAALFVAGIAKSIREGITAANAALDGGKGAAALDQLRATTRAVLAQPALSAD
ncbi:MAG TPA: anthranilate phosphoribosyltransferase, partial [Longimicrobiales bacterium]|nr:anthranilate phosphoribosyltransferase [Longimicrobiales bacterium]